jgi:hypothetical protein
VGTLAVSPDGRRVAVGQSEITDAKGGEFKGAKVMLYALPDLKREQCLRNGMIEGNGCPSGYVCL